MRALVLPTLVLAACTFSPHVPEPVGVGTQDLTKAERMDHARNLVFRGRLDEALAWVEGARSGSTVDPVLDAWIGKIQDARADLWVQEAEAELDAFRHRNASDLASRALEVSPGHAAATRLRDSIDGWLSDRRASADRAFGQALLDASEDRWHEAAAHLEAALADDPGYPDAQRQLDLVRMELAQRRLLLSDELAEASLWGAARQATQLARDLSPETESIDRLVSEAEDEDASAEHLRAAQRALEGGDLSAAREALAVARLRGVRQSDAIEQLEERIRIEQDGLEYERARDLARRRDVEKALALYEGLIERSGHYKDAIARADVLRAVCDEMTVLYRRALDAERHGNTASARALYLEILAGAPFYADVADRLRALQP